MKNDKVYKIHEDGQEYTAEYNSAKSKLELGEDVVKGKVSIIKGKGNGNAGIVSPEVNAQFQVYIASSGSYDKAKDTEKDLLKTNSEGYAITKELPYGTYIVHQISGDDETEYCPDFYVDIKEQGKTYKYLLNNPEFLILDEPINGLDPMGIVEIRELLKKINKEKDMTILISSHILSELSELATTYGIISNGKLIEEITAKQLSEKCRQYIDLRVDDTARAVILLERELGISDYEVLEDSNIKVFSNLDNVGEINSLLSRSGIIVESISVKGENLEEYFMNKVGGVLNA